MNVLDVVRKNTSLKSMILKVKITYRDDKEEIYDCIDFPSLNKFITLYLKSSDFRRLLIPDESIKNIEYWFPK